MTRAGSPPRSRSAYDGPGTSRPAEYPTLVNTSPYFIGTFLTRYDSYVTDIKERHRQRTANLEVKSSIEPPAPVSLKFCVDASWLEGAIFN